MSISKDFVLAGCATFTVETPDGHVTYKVTHKEANGKFRESWFAALLTGPDNEHSYTYLGVLNSHDGSVRLTAKSAYAANSYPVRLLNRILARVWLGDHNAYEIHGYKTHHEGKCGRCGRKLTVPESIERGIGPECWAMMGMA